MDKITRKSLLYKSGLGVYCINHVQGCSHGCSYPCYAYMMAKSYGRVETYEEWCKPKIVVNATELLKKELTKMKMKPCSIHLCLSTDPFMTNYPEVIDMSMKLITLINSFDIKCSILTKGKMPAGLSDSRNYSANNIYGISLVSLNEDFRKQWEPCATPYVERIAALKYLHDCGLNTLAHIEPYPTPNIISQDLNLILESIKFVNHIHFSGWNYNNRIDQFPNHREFYKEQSGIVQRFCRVRNIDCNC